jgi:hypothetical protein
VPQPLVDGLDAVAPCDPMCLSDVLGDAAAAEAARWREAVAFCAHPRVERRSPRMRKG